MPRVRFEQKGWGYRLRVIYEEQTTGRDGIYIYIKEKVEKRGRGWRGWMLENLQGIYWRAVIKEWADISGLEVRTLDPIMAFLKHNPVHFHT